MDPQIHGAAKVDFGDGVRGFGVGVGWSVGGGCGKGVWDGGGDGWMDEWMDGLLVCAWRGLRMYCTMKRQFHNNVMK